MIDRAPSLLAGKRAARMPPSERSPLQFPKLSESLTTLALLVFALAIRSAALLLWPDALVADPDGYRAVAENLARHGTFGNGDSPTAYRPPLYPLALIPCVAFAPASRVPIAGLHVALGLATVWFTYRLARMSGLDRGAWLAALLVACDPILLTQSALVMTETLAAFVAVASLFWIAKAGPGGQVRHAVIAGALVGLAILCRPTFLPWAGLVALLFVFDHHSAKDGLRRSFAFAGAVALVLFPWAARNQIHFGRPIVTTTHGGYTLLLANNPFFYEYLRGAPWGSVWENQSLDRQWSAEMPRGSPADELRADRLAYAKAIQAIRNEPGMFCYACVVRIGRLFGILPHQVATPESMSRRLLRYAVAAWYAAEFVLALYGLVWCLRQSCRLDFLQRWGAALSLVACFAAVHAVYWTDMRMRAPLMPVIAVFAAMGGMALRGIVSNRNL